MNTELLRLSHIFAFILLAATLVTPAFAISTNVNVTFVETVFQNVSFAKDFDLVENRTFSFIVGNLTVANPSSDSVYDIYVNHKYGKSVLQLHLLQWPKQQSTLLYTFK